MKIRTHLKERNFSIDEYRDKARFFLRDNNLESLSHTLECFEGYRVCNPGSQFGMFIVPEKNTQYTEISFNDGFMVGITFLVDDETEQVIGYKLT